MSRHIAIGDIHGNLKALIQVLDRCNFDPASDTIIGLGDYVDGHSQSAEVVELILTFPNFIGIKGNHDCLDEETQVFTDRGWLYYTEISDEDLVLGINPSSGAAEWQQISEIIVKESDHINYWANGRCNFAMTDNHRILHKNWNGFEYTRLKNTQSSRLHIPLSAHSGYDEYDLSDDEIRLAAWILTDGSISNDYSCVDIYQSKTKGCQEIEQILDNLNLTYSKTGRNRVTEFIIERKLKNKPQRSYKYHISCGESREFVWKLSLSKGSLPEWAYLLSQRQMMLFLNTLIKGDGSIYRDSDKNAILYGTENFLSAVQGLCCMCGVAASVTKDNRGALRLNMSFNNLSTFRTDGNNKVDRVEGTFTVWCLQVPFSNFLVRRDGRAYYTGNSWCNEWFKTGSALNVWKLQGGQATLDSYISTGLLTEESHRQFFRNLHNYYILELNGKTYAFVHGGWTSKKGLGHEAHESTYYWDRDLWSRAMATNDIRLYSKDRTEMYDRVFLGHTQTPYARFGKEKYLPVKHLNIWNLDQGAGWDGCLTAMCIETEQYWQSDINLYGKSGR